VDTLKMLPNLSSLSLRNKCAPCGEMFEEFEDAMGSVPPALNDRTDWSPDEWEGEDSPICPLCLDPLHRKSGYGDTKEVEALFENAQCGHCFHRECLELHIQGFLGDQQDRHLRCPTCSRPIAQEVLDTIFDDSANVEEVDKDDGFDEMVAQQQENAARRLNEMPEQVPAGIVEPHLLLPAGDNPDSVQVQADRMTSLWDSTANEMDSYLEEHTAEALTLVADPIFKALVKVMVGWEKFNQISSWTSAEAEMEMDILRQYLREFIEVTEPTPPLEKEHTVANAALFQVLVNKLSDYPLFRQQEEFQSIDWNFISIETYAEHVNYSNTLTSNPVYNNIPRRQAFMFRLKAMLEFWRDSWGYPPPAQDRSR